jgi:hypothetical protein
LTSALVGGEWSALHPRSEFPVSIGQEAGWSSKLVWMTWREERSCPSQDSNSDPSTIQLIASYYFDCTILAPRFTVLTDFKVWFTVMVYKVSI